MTGYYMNKQDWKADDQSLFLPEEIKSALEHPDYNPSRRPSGTLRAAGLALMTPSSDAGTSRGILSQAYVME